MKKYFVSFVFVVIFGGYAALQYLNSSPVAYSAGAAPTSGPQGGGAASAPQSAPPPEPTSSQSGSSPIASASTQSSSAQGSSAPAAQPQGKYKNGTYTGVAADAYWGMVQVQAVIKNGALADVQILQFPNSHGTSVYINQQALPILQSEAIQAQSANVNGVSGATYSSQAFQQSLSSALSQA